VAGSSTVFADVQLTIRDGRVSLIAKDATVRQILTEWARIGQTKVVNLERLPGGPLTLELTNVTEQQALEVLLRSAGGYVLAPRPVAASSLSLFDRIIVMPPSQAPRAVASTPSPAFQPPGFPQPPRAATEDEDDDDDRPALGGLPMPNRGPVFNVFPPPQMGNPQQPFQPVVPGVVPFQPIVPSPGGVPATAPGIAPAPFGGVSVPGMVVPAGQQGTPGRAPE
jgi:hypothetical protein